MKPFPQRTPPSLWPEKSGMDPDGDVPDRKSRKSLRVRSGSGQKPSGVNDRFFLTLVAGSSFHVCPDSNVLSFSRPSLLS